MIINRFLLVATGAAALAGCGSSDDPLATANPRPPGTGGSAHDGGARVTGGSSTNGGATFVPIPMPQCPAGSTDRVECPSQDPEAVFVAAGSNGTGSWDNPLGSVGGGITAATASARHRVVVCNGSYDETVVLSGKLAGGLNLDGGYTCPTPGNAGWQRATRSRPKVRAEQGPALWIQGVDGTLNIRDMEFESPDATEPGDSSITAMVASAQNLQLQDVSIRAGRGATGADGKTGARGDDALRNGPEQEGAAATCDTTPKQGGTRLQGTCRSDGGTGAASTRSSPGKDGGRGSPDESWGGAGGLGSVVSVGSSGKPGAAGTYGRPGSPGRAVGVFSGDRYYPAQGATGDTGKPGQGGGGGGGSAGSSSTSSPCFGAGGGAGGMGGCGGLGGDGGNGGGASVALLVWNSAVTLTACTLATSPGGKGGKGGIGGVGGSGADGSAGGAALATEGIAGGGPGGPGGQGGIGGAGAGGTGGPSLPLVFYGRPVVWDDDTDLLPSPGGEKGEGGDAPREAANGADGLIGLSAASYEQK